MKERPILFSGPMVRALLDGTKTQTRRIAKDRHFGLPPAWTSRICREHEDSNVFIGSGEKTTVLDGCRGRDVSVAWRGVCPYGQPGDRLWVKETFTMGEGVIYRQEWDDMMMSVSLKGLWKPSIFMPRALSRITLEITGIRVERLNSINEEDCLAEGVTGWTCGDRQFTAKEAYCLLWDKINGIGAWDLNPWVWVVEFRMVEFRVVAPGGVVGAGGTPALPA